MQPTFLVIMIHLGFKTKCYFRPLQPFCKNNMGNLLKFWVLNSIITNLVTLLTYMETLTLGSKFSKTRKMQLKQKWVEWRRAEVMHTFPFENCTILRDVGRKWDTRVPDLDPDPPSSNFWLCPWLNCLCREEWLWLSLTDLSLTQRSIRPVRNNECKAIH